ncbi:MAG: signal recognition particle protein [Alphaproteobacteria bacterium]|nr:signal recognition particle protein [Rhizobiaceae bacterium]MBU3961736.1 signal recognition particle protein [Alphaproteobacteria bacterium]MBU4051741.1 signal recognition particle protein [Alphaproteobacteria bacterium]MBU4090048.1 signal recognition particle protein [Alphaproteobacteria bacterium]MBU4157281.1 signal recognition particle protein [Alphaproteobacteria bacterium]
MFDNLQDRLGSILNGLTGRGALSDADVSAALREVRRALLEADVALEVVRNFTDRVREKAVGAAVLKSIKPGQMVVKIVHDELVEMLGSEGVGVDLNAAAPVVIMMVGLQGSGKTTTTGKIAKRLTDRERKKVLMASLDTRRPAAQEQLRQLGVQTGIDVLPVIAGQSPTDIASRAVQAAKLGGHDVVILDTAGRTHIDEPLMVEMADIKKNAKPHEILLVADALTGQDAVNLARNFDERVGITGLVLTRMDGDGRGGAALSMRAVTGKPIKLIGVGEKMLELEEFHPRRIADRILGMGDIVSLVEKAAENIDAEKAAAMAAKMAKGKFDLDDLADQLRQMQKMGGMGGIMGLMPGMSGMKDKMAAAGLNDKLFGRQIAIIQSMTKAERANPEILKHSRKKRIAAGSGTDAAEINKLLKMHRQMADMMKAMGGKKGGGMMKQMMGGLAGKMGLGGMGGMGGMPDLSSLDPKQLEALAKQAEAAGLKPPPGLGGMGGLPGMGGGLPGLGGAKLPGLGGLPGLPKKK